MAAKLQKSDAAGFASAAFAGPQFIAAESITSSPLFQAVLTWIPSSAAWAIAGFLFAAWLFPSWAGDEPRWKQFWRWVNGEFVVERLICAPQIADNGEFAAVVASLRTGRRIESGQLDLRIFSCVGQTIPEEVIVLERFENLPARSRVSLTLARHRLPKPGVSVWSAGVWGADGPNLIRGSDNVAILEMKGRFAMQRHRLRIEHRTPKGSDYDPVLFAVSEEHGIFDTP